MKDAKSKERYHFLGNPLFHGAGGSVFLGSQFGSGFDCVRNKFRTLLRPEGYPAVVMFSGMVPLGYAILWATPFYNGWRHFYFVYAPMMISVGYALHYFLHLCRVSVGALDLPTFWGLEANYEMVKEQYELIGQISSYGSVISATMASTSFAEWSAAAFSNVG